MRYDGDVENIPVVVRKWETEKVAVYLLYSIKMKIIRKKFDKYLVVSIIFRTFAS